MARDLTLGRSGSGVSPSHSCSWSDSMCRSQGVLCSDITVEKPRGTEVEEKQRFPAKPSVQRPWDSNVSFHSPFTTEEKPAQTTPQARIGAPLRALVRTLLCLENSAYGSCPLLELSVRVLDSVMDLHIRGTDRHGRPKCLHFLFKQSCEPVF